MKNKTFSVRTLAAIALMTLLLTMGGCARQDTKSATDTAAADYQAALAQAKTAQRQAAQVGGEWRDTAKLIQAAETAAAQSDYVKAKSLAERASAQGRLGQEQASSQTDVGNPAYLYR